MSRCREHPIRNMTAAPAACKLFLHHWTALSLRFSSVVGNGTGLGDSHNISRAAAALNDRGTLGVRLRQPSIINHRNRRRHWDSARHCPTNAWPCRNGPPSSIGEARS
jgi:hypothetical protein